MIVELKNDPVAFRAALREWLADTVPSGWAARADREGEEAHIDVQRDWLAKLGMQGLAIPHWPSEYGGADLDLNGQIILTDELARAGAPQLEIFTISLNHVPGTLIPCGSEAQKQRYLPEVPKGAIWCQGFSEPSAGSDLAALRTRAVRDGDHYVINGQKIWSSMSRFAQHCILLVRTDPDTRKHAGISFLLMDMDTPGLEVRPIRQMNGHREFSELFLTDVRVPVENLVGAENGGWQVAQATLASERGLLWFDYAERRRILIMDYYRAALEKHAAWLDDQELRREFMAVLAEAQAGRRLIRQLLHENRDGHGTPAQTAAFVKLHDTSLSQRLMNFVTRVEGMEGQRNCDSRTHTRLNGLSDYLWSFASTISGGTNEIIRNIIAERGLGMPRG